MTLKALPFAFLAVLLATPALAVQAPKAAAPAVALKDGALKESALPAPMTLRDVVVARYTEEPASGGGLIHFFRKMTVVDSRLADKDLYILWLRRDEILPKVGAHCDIRYHMGMVDAANHPAAVPQALSDSRIMDDFVCKSEFGKT